MLLKFLIQFSPPLLWTGMDVDQKCPAGTESVSIWCPIVTYHTETTNTLPQHQPPVIRQDTQHKNISPGSCLSQDYSRDSLMRKYFSETSSYKSDEKVVSSGCLRSAQYHLNQSVRIKEIILNRVKLLLSMSQLEQQWAVYQDVIRLNLIDKW